MISVNKSDVLNGFMKKKNFLFWDQIRIKLMLLESHITTCSIRKKNYEKVYLCMFMKQKMLRLKFLTQFIHMTSGER